MAAEADFGTGPESDMCRETVVLPCNDGCGCCCWDGRCSWLCGMAVAGGSASQGLLPLGKLDEKTLLAAVWGVAVPLSYSLCSRGDPEPMGSGRTLVLLDADMGTPPGASEDERPLLRPVSK